MHPSSSRAFQRHQEHNLKHPGWVDLIITTWIIIASCRFQGINNTTWTPPPANLVSPFSCHRLVFSYDNLRYPILFHAYRASLNFCVLWYRERTNNSILNIETFHLSSKVAQGKTLTHQYLPSLSILTWTICPMFPEESINLRKVICWQRAFQRHQKHNLKHPSWVDLITTKQNKLPSFIDRWQGHIVTHPSFFCLGYELGEPIQNPGYQWCTNKIIQLE